VAKTRLQGLADSLVLFDSDEQSKTHPVTSSFHLQTAISSRSLEAFSWRALDLMAGDALAVIGWLVEANCDEEKLWERSCCQ